jgi:hypothetical protein
VYHAVASKYDLHIALASVEPDYGQHRLALVPEMALEMGV